MGHSNKTAPQFQGSPAHKLTKKNAKNKTYNSENSLMVTHSTTNSPIWSLSMAERTGCPIFFSLWSYVICFVLKWYIRADYKIWDFRCLACRWIVARFRWKGIGDVEWIPEEMRMRWDEMEVQMRSRIAVVKQRGIVHMWISSSSPRWHGKARILQHPAIDCNVSGELQ